jgi:hypothetical protein
MAYGKNKGRFRGTRVGRFVPNMGAQEAPVKSTDVERGPGPCALASLELQITLCSCALKRSIFRWYSGLDVTFLTKTGRRRTRTSHGGDGGSRTDDPVGDGGPDEAAAFIAETVTELARVARHHQLGMLVLLLEMAQMEADEHVRLRGKRKLS